DGIYVRAGLEQEKAALLVVIGAMRDGHKEVLAVVPGYRESTDSWRGVLRDLRDRGLTAPKLVVADGAAGVWAAAAEVWPETCGRRPLRPGPRPPSSGVGTTRSSTCSISSRARCSRRYARCSPRSRTRRRGPRRSAGETPSRRRTAGRTRRRSRSS